MKNFNLYLLLLLVASCSMDQEMNFTEMDVKKKTIDEKMQDKAQEEPQNIPVRSEDEIIIQYKDNVTSTEKHMLRVDYDIDVYEVCNCSDGSIEKWTFNDTINIEGKIKRLRTKIKGGVEGIKNVDYEFSFKSEIEKDSLTGISNVINYQSVISHDPTGVKIAVIDSGIDPNYSGFTTHYLFNTTHSATGFINQISGWDYVNENDLAYDDNNKKHGTKVTSIIYNELNNQGTLFQILPLKVADHEGGISAFNLICGIKNAVAFNVNIVNMSLGYYSTNPYDKSLIIEDIIIENDNTLFITSAGNSDSDNDDLTHYPSSFPQENVLSIAAASHTGSEKASFSNYGVESVDFYAIGDLIDFIDYNTASPIIIPISGTSYAAPYVSAKAATILFNSNMSLTPQQIIQQLDVIGDPIPADGEKVVYGKIIR